MMRVERLEAAAALLAHQVLAEALDLPVRLFARLIHAHDMHNTLAQVEGRLDRIGKPAALAAAHYRPVHHHLDHVFAAVIDARRPLDVVGLAIHAHAQEAAAANLLPHRVVFLLPLALDRGHDIDARAVRKSLNLVDDLVGRLRADADAARRTIRMAQPRVENSEIVVDLRDRADRRAWALAGRLLLDADRWRQTRDVLDLRLLHLAEELPCVR